MVGGSFSVTKEKILFDPKNGDGQKKNESEI
jgi:hypothetical protein